MSLLCKLGLHAWEQLGPPVNSGTGWGLTLYVYYRCTRCGKRLREEYST